MFEEKIKMLPECPGVYIMKKKDGKIIVNTQQIDPMPVITGAMSYPENIQEKISKEANSIFVDALAIAESVGNAKAVNVTLIGVLAASTDIPKEKWLTAIEKTVPEKFREVNLKAFEAGYGLKA